MTSPQKSKGSSWERDVATFLTALYNERFLRVPASGAYIGGANAKRKEYLSEGQIRHFKGDIIPGESFPLLNIECKNYAGLEFHQLYFGSCRQLDIWIDQLLQPADANDVNLLLIKITRRGKFACFQETLLNKHVTLPSHYTRYTSCKSGAWYIVDYDKFWQINKDSIKSLSNKQSLAP
jgi:hypothetical protein